jgi:hypothetical protein
MESYVNADEASNCFTNLQAYFTTHCKSNIAAYCTFIVTIKRADEKSSDE